MPPTGSDAEAVSAQDTAAFVPSATPPARYRISAPGPVTGGVYGVAFANGQAVIEDSTQHGPALTWFTAEPGYRVEALDVPESAPAPEPTPEADPSADENPAEPATEPPAAPARRRK